MISFPDSLFNRMGRSSHFEYGFFSRLPFLPTSVLASNSSTLPPTNLQPPWKEWLLISINDISRWFHGQFWTILQVIDLMEKVTKEQSKESTKTNGSFFGSWSWTVELHWSWAQKLPNKVTNDQISGEHAVKVAGAWTARWLKILRARRRNCLRTGPSLAWTQSRPRPQNARQRLITDIGGGTIQYLQAFASHHRISHPCKLADALWLSFEALPNILYFMTHIILCANLEHLDI